MGSATQHDDCPVRDGHRITFAWMKYDPVTYHPGLTGKTCSGIRAEVRDDAGAPVPPGQEGQLALWAPPAQRFMGYIGSDDANDADGWVASGFIARIDLSGEITKLGRSDDRINLGGTRMFSGKLEADLECLDSIEKAVAIGVYADDRAEALGVVAPSQGFDPAVLQASLDRALKEIGGVFVRKMPQIPCLPDGQPDHDAVAKAWPGLVPQDQPDGP